MILIYYPMRLSCILQIIARSITIYNEAERRVIYCNTECYNFNIQRKPSWIIDLSHTPKKNVFMGKRTKLS